jgi:hypothetical protein
VSSPIRGPWPDIYYSLTVTVLFLWGALWDERTSLSFVYAVGPHQRSLSRVRVPWDSWPYFDLPVSSIGRGTDDIENTDSFIAACLTVFTELLPDNALINSVTILKYEYWPYNNINVISCSLYRHKHKTPTKSLSNRSQLKWGYCVWVEISLVSCRCNSPTFQTPVKLYMEMWWRSFYTRRLITYDSITKITCHW